MIGGYGYVNMENTRDYCTTCMVPNMHSTHGELLHDISFACLDYRSLMSSTVSKFGVLHRSPETVCKKLDQ